MKGHTKWVRDLGHTKPQKTHHSCPEVVRYYLPSQIDVFWKGNKGAKDRPWQSGGRRGQTRWSMRHEASLHKHVRKASIHLHLSLLILALTFQNWQMKSSAGVWQDAMQGRLLNSPLTAFDRYRVFALSHHTRGCGRYSLFPHMHHAMPLWPVWTCVHKQAESQQSQNVATKLAYD